VQDTQGLQRAAHPNGTLDRLRQSAPMLKRYPMCTRRGFALGRADLRFSVGDRGFEPLTSSVSENDRPFQGDPLASAYRRHRYADLRVCSAPMLAGTHDCPRFPAEMCTRCVPRATELAAAPLVRYRARPRLRTAPHPTGDPPAPSPAYRGVNDVSPCPRQARPRRWWKAARSESLEQATAPPVHLAGGHRGARGGC
jgi:hypothetical protein